MLSNDKVSKVAWMKRSVIREHNPNLEECAINPDSVTLHPGYSPNPGLIGASTFQQFGSRLAAAGQ
jgi:hypothetical protein